MYPTFFPTMSWNELIPAPFLKIRPKHIQFKYERVQTVTFVTLKNTTNAFPSQPLRCSGSKGISQREKYTPKSFQTWMQFQAPLCNVPVGGSSRSVPNDFISKPRSLAARI
mmetsp:Transcript_40849/g.65612  ORF Transcript_40849/g.65612 Transcript_40849/m.65612 type:complete len:111 (+) Transcript_40849:1382-1714(+)